MTIDGERIALHKRKYCLDCSPFIKGSNKISNRKTLEKHNKSESFCKECNSIKPIDQFYFRHSGLPLSICKKCHHEESKQQTKSYKEQAVAYKGGSCELCNYSKCLDAMDFHHKDPTQKDFTFSRRFPCFKTAKPELDKCMLLCANCHREEHQRMADIDFKNSDHGQLDPLGHRCRRCNLHKTINSFPIDKGIPKPWCKSCTRLYGRQGRAKIKQEIISYKGGVCEICSYNKNIAALDLHHKDPTQKSFGIAEMRDKYLSEIKDEVDKCILTCVNCHREQHVKP